MSTTWIIITSSLAKNGMPKTGLDYFGARHYSNGLGRFITPDWAAKPTAVPNADFADPQSLNLYTNVRNVPTTSFHREGHCEGPIPTGSRKTDSRIKAFLKIAVE